MGDMLVYSEDQQQIPSGQQQAAHALYVGDTDRGRTRPIWAVTPTRPSLTNMETLAGRMNRPRWAAALTLYRRTTRGRSFQARSTQAPWSETIGSAAALDARA